MSQPGDVTLRGRDLSIFDLRRGIRWGHGEEKPPEFDKEVLLPCLLADAGNTGSRPFAVFSWIVGEGRYLVRTVHRIFQRTRKVLLTFFQKLYIEGGC